MGIAGESLREVSYADGELVKYEPEHIQGYYEQQQRKSENMLRRAGGS